MHHAKDLNWFLALGAAGVVLVAFCVLVLKDLIAAVGSLVMVVAIGVVAGRSPRTLRYVVDDQGVHVGDRLFGYEQFQSFSVQPEDGVPSVVLMPRARFKPSLTVYFSKEDGEKIVDTLGNYLPMEEHKTDLVDKISTKLRF